MYQKLRKSHSQHSILLSKRTIILSTTYLTIIALLLANICNMTQIKLVWQKTSHRRLISPTFCSKLLGSQIPSQVVSIFLRFWDPRTYKLCVKCWWNWHLITLHVIINSYFFSGCWHRPDQDVRQGWSKQAGHLLEERGHLVRCGRLLQAFGKWGWTNLAWLQRFRTTSIMWCITYRLFYFCWNFPSELIRNEWRHFWCRGSHPHNLRSIIGPLSDV